jgi:hypothetical protein
MQKRPVHPCVLFFTCCMGHAKAGKSRFDLEHRSVSKLTTSVARAVQISQTSGPITERRPVNSNGDVNSIV